MANKDNDKEAERVDECYTTLFGPNGHPELSLIVTVNSLSKQVQMLMRFGWSISALGTGLVVKELWTLMTHGVG